MVRLFFMKGLNRKSVANTFVRASAVSSILWIALLIFSCQRMTWVNRTNLHGTSGVRIVYGLIFFNAQYGPGYAAFARGFTNGMQLDPVNSTQWRCGIDQEIYVNETWRDWIRPAIFSPRPFSTGTGLIYTHGLSVPFSMLAWMSLLPLAIRSILRRWKYVPLGHCKKCGYDLRATPDRCPECGAIPQNAK
jgi:hypothetical protein